MRTRILAFGLIVAVMVVGGCSHHHYSGHHGYGSGQAAIAQATVEVKALLARTIQDPERASQIEAIMKDITAEVKGIGQQQRYFHQQMYDLNANYHATPEQFLKLLDEMGATRMQAGSKILALRFKMKDLMTEQEWKELTDGMAEMRSRYRAPSSTTKNHP